MQHVFEIAVAYSKNPKRHDWQVRRTIRGEHRGRALYQAKRAARDLYACTDIACVEVFECCTPVLGLG